MKTHILLISISFLFLACSSTNKHVQVQNTQQEKQVSLSVSQNPLLYAQNIDANINKQDKKFKHLLKKHFKPWEIRKFSFTKEEAQWGLMYAKKDVYSSNFQKIPSSWFKKQTHNSNFKKYNTLMKNAITVNNSNLRVFPSDDTIFYNFKDNASALAFDYNQASSIKINTPIVISHLSKDKAWAYAQTAYTSGWLKMKDLAYVSAKLIKIFKTKDYFIATKDNFAVYKHNMFIENVKIGTIFPYKRGKKSDEFFIVRKHGSLKGLISYIHISKDNVKKAPIAFNTSNLTSLTNELINEPYGWGGTFHARDCSELTRDFLSPFGIYLDRNSRSQSKNGKYLSMEKLNNEEKKAFLIKNGIPFLTLLYKQGHIMLYIGHKNNEPIIFHNLWSIVGQDKDGLKNKNIIGKAVISSLEPFTAKNQENKDSLLSKVKGLVLLNN